MLSVVSVIRPKYTNCLAMFRMYATSTEYLINDPQRLNSAAPPFRDPMQRVTNDGPRAHAPILDLKMKQMSLEAEASESRSFKRFGWMVALSGVLIAFFLRPKAIQLGESTLTLRQVLEEEHHMAWAPSFFGFYSYFGVLSALPSNNNTVSVSGASAGAMLALWQSTGAPADRAADFCTNKITLSKFADFPGLLAWFRGNLFEKTMDEFLATATDRPRMMETTPIRVAVTGFDLERFKTIVMTKGPMARAARASATFPTLFQPVGWSQDQQRYTLVDGGIEDPHGWVGTTHMLDSSSDRETIVTFRNGGISAPGPQGFVKTFRSFFPRRDIPKVRVISVIVQNLPMVSPLALEKGPIAVNAARQAITNALDVPLQRNLRDQDHYVLFADTKPYQ